MSEYKKKFVLDEERIPKAWYNIVADLPTPPAPPLNPATLQIQSWSAENRWIFSSPGTEHLYVCEGGVVDHRGARTESGNVLPGRFRVHGHQ